MYLLKGSLIIISFGLLAVGCSSSRKTADVKDAAPAKGQVCSNAGKSTAELSWVKVANPRPAETGGRMLPAQFESFTIENNQLKAFFAEAKQPGHTTIVHIPVPAPIGCQEFEVKPAAAMPEELAVKYPDIASLQGIGTENRAGDLRLDYDGTRLHAQVIWNGRIFLVTPVELDKKVIYMIYDRNGTAENKEPFESPGTYRNDNGGNKAPATQKYDR